VFYSYVIHKTTIITQALFRFVLLQQDSRSMRCTCYSQKFGHIQEGLIFLPQNNSEYSPLFKTVLSTYGNILRNALHRLQEGVLYFLNIRLFRVQRNYNLMYA